jgi:hypothetical protein
MGFKVITVVRPEDLLGVNLASFIDPVAGMKAKTSKKAVEQVLFLLSSEIYSYFLILFPDLGEYRLLD